MVTYDIRATGRDPTTGLVFVEISRNGKPWRALVVSDDEATRMAAVFDRAADEGTRSGVRKLPSSTTR